MNWWKTYLLITMVTILTVAQFIAFFFFYNQAGYTVLRYIGWITWVLSIVFGWWPIYTLRNKGGVAKGKSFVHTTVLVESDLYAIVRHPQYLAGILLNIALMLISQHWVSIGLGIPAAIFMYLDIQKADQLGIEKFGAAYKSYMERVPQVNFIWGLIRLAHRKNVSR